MISRLNYKNKIDVYEFINRCKDIYQDLYITINKERIFLTNIKIIEKILKKHEVYVVEEPNIKGILIILNQKGFRTYIKVLSEKLEYTYDLLKYVDWNFKSKELFMKVKKTNPITQVLKRYNWQIIGNRGEEILFFKPKKIILEKKNVNHNAIHHS